MILEIIVSPHSFLILTKRDLTKSIRRLQCHCLIPVNPICGQSAFISSLVWFRRRYFELILCREPSLEPRTTLIPFGNSLLPSTTNNGSQGLSSTPEMNIGRRIQLYLRLQFLILYLVLTVQREPLNMFQVVHWLCSICYFAPINRRSLVGLMYFMPVTIQPLSLSRPEQLRGAATPERTIATKWET